MQRLFVYLYLVLSIGACSTEHRVTKENKQKAYAQRIAALSPAVVEILYALECDDRIVLRSQRANYPEDVTRLPKTNGLALSVEHVASYKPDLILLSHIDSRARAGFKALFIDVRTFEPKRVEEVFDNIQTIARLCGAKSEKTRTFLNELRVSFSKIKTRVAKQKNHLRIYVEIDGSDPARPWTIGSTSFLADLVRLSGAKNIFNDIDRAYLQVSAEEVIRADPDIILLAGGAIQDASRLKTRKGWRNLAAIRNDKIIDSINPDILSRPGPRVIEGLAALVDIVIKD